MRHFARESMKTGNGLSSRGHCGRLFQLSERPARSLVHIGRTLERKLLQVSVLLCLAGAVGLCWPAISQLRSTAWVSSAEASIDPPISRRQRFSRRHGKAEAGIVKLDPFSNSTYAPSVKARLMAKVRTRLGREIPANTVARAWSRLQKKSAQRGRAARNMRPPTETEPEAFRPACITRGRSTVRRG